MIQMRLFFNSSSPSPPLPDIVLFGLLLFELPLKVFKTRLLGRGSHTLIKNVLFSSPTDVRSHNPPPFVTQHPHWHSLPSPIDMGPPNPAPSGLSVLASTLPRVHPSSGFSLLAGTSPGVWVFPFRVFKTHLLGRGFHTLRMFRSPPQPTWDLGFFQIRNTVSITRKPIQKIKTK